MSYLFLKALKQEDPADDSSYIFGHPSLTLPHPRVSFFPTPRIFLKASHIWRMSLVSSPTPTPFPLTSPFLALPPCPPPSLVPCPPSPSKRICPSEPRCYQRRKGVPRRRLARVQASPLVVPSEFLASPLRSTQEALRGRLAVPCVSMDQTLLCSSLKVPERSSLQK